MFRIDRPSDDDLALFHQNGYVAFPDVLTDAGREGLTNEILSTPEVVKFLQMTDEERGQQRKPHRLNILAWNDKGPFAEQLFDAPLVTALLRAIIGETYHFSQSTVRISMPGAEGLEFHQDNHPIDLSEQNKWCVQMLYYPDGFERGDASLWVIPGSHRITDWRKYAPYGPRIGEMTPELLTEIYGDQIGKEVVAEELALPPGSMVVMNAKMFHAVSPKALDSPQPIRLFANYVFKESNSPHNQTQSIPPEWIEKATPERRKLFEREASPLSPEDSRFLHSRYS